jgi:hypothetical protein
MARSPFRPDDDGRRWSGKNIGYRRGGWYGSYRRRARWPRRRPTEVYATVVAVLAVLGAMEHSANGASKGGANVSEARPESEMRKERFRNYRRSALADSEQFGNVVARIYANETHAGEVVFKVELVRRYSMSNGSGEAFSFEFRDIQEAIRGLKWALSWMWRAARQRRKSSKRTFW